MTKRVRETPEVRREQILDAALRLISESGFHGTTIRAIARQAGINEGLIYHYFDDKEALVDALLERLESRRDGVLRMLDPQQSLAENMARVRSFLDVQGRLRDDTMRLVRMVLFLAAEAKGARKKAIGGIISRGLDRVEELFSAAMRRDEIRVPDCRTAARHFVGGVLMSLMMQNVFEMAARDKLSMADFFDQACQVFMRGAGGRGLLIGGKDA